MAKVYTQNMHEGKILHEHRETRYLCSKTATYVGNGEEVQETIEDKRNKKDSRVELRI